MIKKGIVYTLILVLSLLALTGCGLLPGGKDTPETAPVPAPTNEDIADEVIWNFLAMCKIPHISGSEAALSANLEFQIKKMGFTCVRDMQNNIIAEIPATSGYEDAPLTILQGHMDMVSAKEDIGSISTDLDPINAIVSGNVVQSDRKTALGADCGMANAAILYYISNPDFVHGPLRVIFTTGGEENMTGARGIDGMYLQKARYFINVDGFQLENIVDSDAASRRETYTMPLTTAPVTKDRALKIEVKGFTGGHYGSDMWRKRANALKIMAEFLAKAQKSVDFELADFSAGGAIDSIPGQCEAVVVLNQYDRPAFETILYEMMYELQETYKDTEPGGTLTCSVTNMPSSVLSWDCKTMTIHLINGFFDGIYKQSEETEKDVTASANVERIAIQDGQIRIVEGLRGVTESDMQALVSRNMTLCGETGFTMQAEELRPWVSDRKNNKLLSIVTGAYNRRTGSEMRVITAHADLETPIFMEKNPYMYAVTIGLDIVGAHTVNEYVRKDSIGPFVKILASALQSIAAEIPEGEPQS